MESSILKKRERFIDESRWMRNIKITYPRFKSFEARIKSFDNFPVKCEVRRKAFAEAGFFYSGTADWVFCYHCDTGLKEFGDNEEPITMHKVYFPDCPIVKEIDDRVLDEYDNVLISTQSISREERRDLKVNTIGSGFKCNRFITLKEENH